MMEVETDIKVNTIKNSIRSAFAWDNNTSIKQIQVLVIDKTKK
jgi:hypothetical protein